jgi:hypothetical protein
MFQSEIKPIRKKRKKQDAEKRGGKTSVRPLAAGKSFGRMDNSRWHWISELGRIQ